MAHRVRRVSVLLAALCLIVFGTDAERVIASACPCTIWTPAATPANPAVTDGQPIEVGVKFRSDVDGFVTALRFYKGAANTGVHVGHLWSAGGTLLAQATFTNESGAGYGAPTATIVTTGNNSLVFGVGNDWNHAIPQTPGPNQAIVHQYLAPVDDTYWVQRVVPAIPVSGTSVTLNDVAPTSDRWNLAVVEIVPR